MSLFEPRRESMPRDRLEQLQLERLQAVIARLRRNVRRCRDTLADCSVQSLADLPSLPVTEPADLVDAFPYGLFALPLREVIRMHSTIGHDGRQLVIGHTRNDLSHWGRLVARQLIAAGVTAHDVLQICFAGSSFEGAFGFMNGAETIEASVIPEDPFHIEHQLATLRNYRVTALVTTPSNALRLVELLDARRLDPETLALRTVLLTRPVSGELRDRLHTGLFAEIHASFGVPELLNPGLCVECPHGHLHLNEDHFLAETRGDELLVTTLCREAMPLLRYATRIAAELLTVDCPCGRTGRVIIPHRRLDDRLLVNETPLYPAQVAEVLAQTRAADAPFETHMTERTVVIDLTLTRALFADTMRTLVDLKQHVESEVLTRLGIEAEVRFRGNRPQ